MQLSFNHKQKLTRPVSFLLNYHNSNNAKVSSGSVPFQIENTIENNGDGEFVHTLTFSVLVDIISIVKEPKKIQIRSLDGKKTIEATAPKKVSDVGCKLIGQYKIVVDKTDNTYTVESVWENIATSKIKVGKDYVVPKSVTFNLTQDYKDVIIHSYQEAFLAVVKLNQQHSFLSNPTISLLLHLIAVGDSNYTPVFLEWFEEQFVNIKDEYRCLFGNSYLQEYQQLKEKDMTNTDLLCTNAVANEHLLLCVTTQQEPNTEIVNDEPQEIAKTVDTPLTHSYTLSGQSLSASETNDLLFEELASEGFFDDDDNNRSIDRINKYIVWRQGQNEFRQKLLEAYSCCAITGCISEEALEAAHIKPYSKTKNNDPTNGLLLRADIHTLFDRHLIGIDPDTMTVYVAPSLLKDYRQFDGKRLQLEDKKLSPNKDALRDEYEEYKKMTGYNKQKIAND